MSNIKAYFAVLAVNPGDVDLEPKDYFMAIAALRHLYRCQVKGHEPVRTVNDKGVVREIHRIGRVPGLFFAAADVRTELDVLFAEEMRSCLAAKS